MSEKTPVTSIQSILSDNINQTTEQLKKGENGIFSNTINPDGTVGVEMNWYVLSDFDAKISERTTDPNFDLEGFLLDDTKQFIEVAGPTLSGFSMVPDDIYPNGIKNILVSNIHPGVPYYNNDGEMELQGTVDFEADSRALPFKDNSVDGVLASCLMHDTRDETLKEMNRVLKQGGIIIWQGAIIDDIVVARDLGLRITDYEETRSGYRRPDSQTYMNVIFQKPHETKSVRSIHNP